MPVVTVVKANGDLTAAANRNLATLLGTLAPVGWVKGLILQSDPGNTSASGGIKVGGSAMTSTNYDTSLLPGDSDNDSPNTLSPVMLTTRYVRTDEATDQLLIIRFQQS